MNDKIIICQYDKLYEQLEVKIENETVCLNNKQIALLFDRDVKTIGKHIANVRQEELKGYPVVSKFATTAKMYNRSERNILNPTMEIL